MYMIKMSRVERSRVPCRVLRAPLHTCFDHLDLVQLCHEVHRLQPSSSCAKAAAGGPRANRSTLGGRRVGAMTFR